MKEESSERKIQGLPYFQDIIHTNQNWKVNTIDQPTVIFTTVGEMDKHIRIDVRILWNPRMIKMVSSKLLIISSHGKMETSITENLELNSSYILSTCTGDP